MHMACSLAGQTPGIWAIGITDVVDSDGIVIVAAQSYEFVKKFVVILGIVGFALVLSRDK